MTSPQPIISIASALITNGQGQWLLVRKQGSAYFMQAGGKIEAGEIALAALQRELAEELSLTIQPDEARYLGAFTAPAANESGHRVEAEIFLVQTSQPIMPQAELAEARWFTLAEAEDLQLAPLTREQLLPLAATLSA